jgi:hypothetical protein
VSSSGTDLSVQLAGSVPDIGDGEPTEEERTAAVGLR